MKVVEERKLVSSVTIPAHPGFLAISVYFGEGQESADKYRAGIPIRDYLYVEPIIAWRIDAFDRGDGVMASSQPHPILMSGSFDADNPAILSPGGEVVRTVPSKIGEIEWYPTILLFLEEIVREENEPG